MNKLPLLPRDFNGAVVHDPLSAYKISDSDDASDPQYYGYVSVFGNWYIQKISGGNTFRYAKGNENYTAAWANRSSIGYDVFSTIF